MTALRFRPAHLLIGLAMLGLLFDCFGPDIPKAAAATYPPCSQHYIGTPYIPYVGDHGPFLKVGGQIGGCPSPGLNVIGYTLVANIALQSSDDYGISWTDEATCSQTKGIGRYWRYARQAGCTTPAVLCRPGVLWRGLLTGRDSAGPIEPVESVHLSWQLSDEGENGCGEPGGA